MGKEKWNYLIYIIWYSYLIIATAIMFGRGFLLSRRSMPDHSECVPSYKLDCDGTICPNSLSKNNMFDDNDKLFESITNPDSPKICSTNVTRLVILLIDALRYDFTLYDPNILKPLAYQNRLPVVKKLLDDFPEHSRLFRFVADPPTTTLQRIKALATGSLPTFVDAGSNFAAIELQEDNFIDQVLKNNGKAVLLGDDTWSRLMPDRWLRSYAYYSFHTWDLDTVDKEVDSRIYDELQKDDWTLMIAHYLGVDHAGHRYGPNHPEMTRKLNETNYRIEKIISLMPKNALLFVVGDHGMTDSGDHGGESRAERTAAFFSYYHPGYGTKALDIIGKEVQQTDFAATVCAALGRPPPAPSLGTVLLPVLPQMSAAQILLLLTNNLKQIKDYMLRYGEISEQISPEKLAELINATRDQISKAADLNTSQDIEKYIKDIRLLVSEVRDTFREVWVEFDSTLMSRGLLLQIFVIFFNWLVAEGIPIENITLIFSSSFLKTGLTSLLVATSMCCCAYYFHVLLDLEHAIVLTTGLTSSVIFCLLVIMYWDSITQRWTDAKLKFYETFSRSVLFLSALALLSNSYIVEEGACLSFLVISILTLFAWSIKTFKAFLICAICGFVLTVSRIYRGCREEQGECWTAGYGIQTNQASRAGLVFGLGSVAAVMAVTRRYLGWQGYGVALGGLFICSHWAVGWGSLGSTKRSRLLARSAWVVIAALFVLIWIRSKRSVVLPLCACTLTVYLANTLVLGATYAPAATIALLSGYLVLNMVKMLKHDGSKNVLSARCSLSVASLWALLAQYHFYGTGHHATLGHIRWAPAFHAGDPTHMPIGNVVVATLMSLELFGMPFMYGAALPLLVFWGCKNTSASPQTQMAAVFSLSLKFILCFSIRVFMCALSATIHCRHLMVWGVFTPKFLFECGSCIGAMAGATLGVALTAHHLPNSSKKS